MKKQGFDNELYVKSQIDAIKDRIKMFDNKLYWSLEENFLMIIML